MASDYPILGPSTISLPTFAAILTNAHSPAASDAPAMYAAIRAYGVDPAVVLAVMQHESSFGKAGIAIGRNNLAGARWYSGILGTTFGATNRGGWAAFPTYAASAGYTASLLASHASQGTNGGTARTFPNWYAPASDGNKPAAYGLAVVNAINGWTGGVQATATEGKLKAPTTPAKAPTATAAGPVGGISSSQLYGVVVVAVAAILVLLVVKR